MSERPILFSGAMVRAILAGTKTQTRRVVKWPEWVDEYDKLKLATQRPATGLAFMVDGQPRRRFTCRYGRPGDRLWVKETAIIAPPNWADVADGQQHVVDRDGHKRLIQYLATAPDQEAADDFKLKATSSIHMPRWASRITLEVTDVRVERLEAISDQDAVAEGVVRERGRDVPAAMGGGVETWRDYLKPEGWVTSPVSSYRSLWESINGPGSWAANPWVWVVEFKRIESAAAQPATKGREE